MDRAPARVSRTYDREVEHVYDLAVQEVPIALPPGDELSHSSVARGKYLPIEEAVYDIAKAPCYNERDAQTEW